MFKNQLIYIILFPQCVKGQLLKIRSFIKYNTKMLILNLNKKIIIIGIGKTLLLHVLIEFATIAMCQNYCTILKCLYAIIL